MANKTILDFPSASTPLSLTDILYLLQGSGTDRDRQTSLDDLQSAIVTTLSPIGEVKQYDKSFPNTPVISDNWVECDGGVISDSASPYDGYRTRNLNGGSVILTATTWAAGVATVAATDVTGLGVGDFVSGAGIAADSYITGITGNVITISDTAFSGAIDTTFTNGGRFVRGGSVSGIGKDHAFQGHLFNGTISSIQIGAGASTGAATTWSSASQTFLNMVDGFEIVEDVSNGYGAPRFDTETRPIYTAQTFIMRIK